MALRFVAFRGDLSAHNVSQCIVGARTAGAHILNLHSVSLRMRINYYKVEVVILTPACLTTHSRIFTKEPMLSGLARAFGTKGASYSRNFAHSGQNAIVCVMVSGQNSRPRHIS